ncbi:MAG: flagellar hook-length control protein FliK [Anaerolineales bacterium]|nr:flagellar hook-length control protein FliK [Anaerolineales bacterium]
MNGVHSIPINSVQRVDDPALMLRMNQRITAEILQVSNDQVALALDGTQVIARMTSSDQAAALQEQRVAQFIVRGFEQGMVTLQLLRNPDAQGAAPQAPPELIPNILRLHHLPDDPETVLIAEALLEKGETITPNAVQALKDALSSFQEWGQPQAQAASALYADGMPLSKQAIVLNQEPQQPLDQVAADLMESMKTLDLSFLARETREALNIIQETLQSLPLNLMTADGVADRLQQIIQLFGHPLEFDLAQMASGREISLSENILFALQRVKASLNPMQHAEVIQNLDRFLDSLQHVHLANVARASSPDELSPLEFHIPIAIKQPASETGQQHKARLRISREKPAGAEPTAMPSHVNLRVDLPDGAIDINLTISSRKIGALIATNSIAIQEAVEEEIPRLKDDLGQQGFQLTQSRCVLDSFDEPAKKPGRAWSSLSAVNLEV